MTRRGLLLGLVVTLLLTTHGVATPAEDGSCRLTVRNLTAHRADVYADGQYVISVDPNETRHVHVQDGETQLYARATCHKLEWGPESYPLGREFDWPLE